MSGLRMAKSSPEEMEQMLEFFNGLEAIFEGEFEQSDWGDYDEEQKEAVGKYVAKWWGKFLDGSWGRFYWGFDTLLRSATDPHLNYLEWKPEIKAVLNAHEEIVASEAKAQAERTRELDFTVKQIAELLDTRKNFIGFSGETCESDDCGKTANVVHGGLCWECCCGQINTNSGLVLYRQSPKPLHEVPDLGPSREVILQGYRASKKHAAIAGK